MNYCVTLQLRRFEKGISVPFINSFYYETNTVRDLNDWLHHHICNTSDNFEIINLFFEVTSDKE